MIDEDKLVIIDDPIKPGPPATAEDRAKQLEWYARVKYRPGVVIATTGWIEDKGLWEALEHLK